MNSSRQRYPKRYTTQHFSDRGPSSQSDSKSSPPEAAAAAAAAAAEAAAAAGDKGTGSGLFRVGDTESDEDNEEDEEVSESDDYGGMWQ